MQNASTEFNDCFADEECKNELDEIENTEICLNCSFIPEDWTNWNMPLNDQDAYCF